jgi:hypothetical protein
MIDVIRTMRSAKRSDGSRNPQILICKSNAIVVSIGGTASGSEDGIAESELKVKCRQVGYSSMPFRTDL